ncbi:MAG: carboxypeptidase regulatory-like domain-containing protein, partial [Pyrinomonadaceae bacterium]
YGLPPGRYRVSAGSDTQSGSVRVGRGGYYARTFHPDVREESRAKVVEVTAGGEATDIDISLGSMEKTYKVVGRVVDAESGQPLANMTVLSGTVDRNSQRVTGGLGGTRTDARGEFQLSGFPPGRYGVLISPEGQSEWYSDTATFDVSDSDVGGVSLKAHRGTSISGFVVLEGINDRAALAHLPRLTLYAYPAVARDGGSITRPPTGQVNPDRSFFMSGVRPGKVRIGIGGWPRPKGFSILRVERGGVEQRDGLDLTSGEPAHDVRLVLAYGAGVVRGQVRIDNGVLPAGAQVMVHARRLGAGGDPQSQPWERSDVDARGRFAIEGLSAGEYELVLNVYAPGPARHNARPVRQNVTVADRGETTVTLVLDLGGDEKEKGAQP